MRGGDWRGDSENGEGGRRTIRYGTVNLLAYRRLASRFIFRAKDASQRCFDGYVDGRRLSRVACASQQEAKRYPYFDFADIMMLYDSLLTINFNSYVQTFCQASTAGGCIQLWPA